MFCILHKRTCKKERERDKVGERREKAVKKERNKKYI